MKKLLVLLLALLLCLPAFAEEGAGITLTPAVLSGTTSQRVCVPARAGAVRQQRNGRKKRLMRIMESGFSFLK